MNGASDNVITDIGLRHHPVSSAGVHSSTFLTSTLTRKVLLPPLSIRQHLPKTVRAGTDSLLSQKDTCDKMTVMIHGK